MNDCYVERPTKEEAIEIVERAVSNGVECFDAVEGMDVTAKGRFYEYDKYEYWGVNVHRGTYTNDILSSWAEKATKLTMDEYRAKFPCAKYDVKQDEWPKVGDVCEFKQDEAGWIKISIRGFAEIQSKYIIEEESGWISLIPKESEFRQLATDRERFIDVAKDVLVKFEQSESVRERMAEALYDADFKAPENNNENT